MVDEVLQPSFRLSEFLLSTTAERGGLDNTPGPAELANIRDVLAPGMQRVRNALGCPVFILSGYRSPAVNAAVGSHDRSQHRQGLAADFIAPGFGTAKTVTRYLMQRSGEIRFDQLIWEQGWVHISFTPGRPRSEVLTARFAGGLATYSPGLA